jgi:endo-1,4-beta-D-glucanase Y
MNQHHGIISRRNLVLSSSATAALAACGGGGSNPEGIDDNSIERDTAQFNAACPGPGNLNYRTPTQAQWSERFNAFYSAIMGSGTTTTGSGTIQRINPNNGGLFKFTAGDRTGYILDSSDSTVKSEGMGYGMLLAAMANDHRRFRALRNYTMSRVRMRRPDSEDGLLRWRLRESDAQPVNSNGSITAPDGEIYVITALLMAEGRGWHTISIDNATINYGSDADALLGALAANFRSYFYNGDNPTTTGGPRPYANLVRFIKDAGFTDPSYANPAFFQYWHQKRPPTATRTANWGNLVNVHRQLLIDSTSRNGGRPSNYSTWAGVPTNFPGSSDGYGTAYSWDAYRVIFNQALDRNWNGNTSHTTNMNALLSTLGNTGANKPPAQQYMLATAANGGVNECNVSEYVKYAYGGALDTGYYAGLLGAIACGFLGGRLTKL